MPASTWTATPPEVGSVYEYVYSETDKTDVPTVILTLASWSESGRHKAIFVALDKPELGWWTNVWNLDLIAWNRAWRKRA